MLQSVSSQELREYILPSFLQREIAQPCLQHFAYKLCLIVVVLDKLIDRKNYAQAMEEELKPLIDSVKNTSNTLWDEILNEKDKEISDLKKIIESKDLAISGLIKQNDEAKKIHDKDVKALADKDDQILLLKETNQHAADEVYCFANKCGQYKSDVASLKLKIKRERIIILIVIAILTALFFLKGSIGD